MKKYFVFIGYTGKDKNYAEYIYYCLSRIQEIQPYLAEIMLDYGENFKEKIMNMLDASDFMVALLTDNGILSPWVNQELGYAFAVRRKRRKKLNIIPITQENTKLEGLITKDSQDVLIIEKFPDFRYIVGEILIKIRSVIPNGWKEGALSIIHTCSNCKDKRGRRFKFVFQIPDFETLDDCFKQKNFVLTVPCPQCKNLNEIDIRTFAPPQKEKK